MPRALSLFAGAGGGAEAARRAGYDVLAVEYDKDACQTLWANGFDVLQADIKRFNFNTLQGFDLVIGGPPCQPFSQSGRNAGEVDQRDCIPDFVRAVEALRPRVFVMENVKGLTYAKHEAYLKHVLCSFPSRYLVDHRVLAADDYGVAQRRKRLFVVGRTDRSVVWPLKQGPQPTLASVLPKRRDLPAWAHERSSTTVVASFRPDIIAGPGYRLAGDGPRQNAPGSIITSAKERAAIQAFPEGWKFAGSKASVDKQLGNACPPAFLGAVIEAQTELAQVSAMDFERSRRRILGVEKGDVTVGDMHGDGVAYEDRCFLTEDRLTGFGITPDGDLTSMFNVGPSGRGRAALALAVQEGARTLDCFAPFLPAWYGSMGWVVDHWEDNYEPGGPRVAYMRYQG